jgi:hypothetical protein
MWSTKRGSAKNNHRGRIYKACFCDKQWKSYTIISLGIDCPESTSCWRVGHCFEKPISKTDRTEVAKLLDDIKLNLTKLLEPTYDDKEVASFHVVEKKGAFYIQCLCCVDSHIKVQGRNWNQFSSYISHLKSPKHAKAFRNMFGEERKMKENVLSIIKCRSDNLVWLIKNDHQVLSKWICQTKKRRASAQCGHPRAGVL